MNVVEFLLIFYPFRMNTNKMETFILHQLAECIVQSRIDVNKSQLHKFNDFIYGVKKNVHSLHNIHIIIDMLEKLILVHKLDLKDRIDQMSQGNHILIIFTLKNCQNQEQILSELWSIRGKKKKAQIEDKTYQTMANIFQETLLFLNKQPLFSEYQQNSDIRQTYIISYNIALQNSQNSGIISNIISEVTLLDMNQRHSQSRASEVLEISIQCYSFQSFDNIHSLPTIQKFKNIQQIREMEKKQNHLTFEYQISDSETSQKSEIIDEKNNFSDDQNMMMNEQQYPNLQLQKQQRRLSLYQFYDQNLNLTVLSNDDKSFMGELKESVKQIELEMEDQTYKHILYRTQSDIVERRSTGKLGSQQFEVLEISKDQKFLTDNFRNFEKMNEVQQFYYLEEWEN